MLNMQLSQIESLTGGSLSGSDAVIHSVAIDSRDSVIDTLFVAINGENVDGHDYLEQALSGGASGALVERYCESQLPQVKVESCVKALADIAKANRNEFSGLVLSITGSCGKTSTKEMLVSILSQFAKVSSTRGNQNNEIGVPLTVFAIDDNSEFAVVEMGAAQQGDIAYLMNIAQPDIAVITNVRSAHIGRFGSDEIIAETKAEIYTHLKRSGKAVINLDEKYSARWKDQLQVKDVITYSIDNAAADIYASDIVTSENSNLFAINYAGESVEINMQIPGMHNIANALCAAACAIAAGSDLKSVAAGLETFVPVASRLQKLEGFWGGVLIDDTYNASPASVNAAIDVLARYPGRRFLVLGDMAELGEASQTLHAEVGAYARSHAIDVLLTCGKDSAMASDAFGKQSKHFIDKKSLSDYLLEEVKDNDVILIKGSRSAALEEVVVLLKKKVIQ